VAHLSMAKKTQGMPKEADYQRTIVAAAQVAGWLVHAERPAQTSHGRWLTNVQGRPGFPDLTLVHPKRQVMLFIELKRKPNKATHDQLLWLWSMRQCGVQAAVVYVPDQLDDFLRFLTTEEETVWSEPSLSDEMPSPESP
jgi:hypothetical protein